MDAFDVFIPAIVQGASEWVEDRYGRFAGWVAFFGLLIGLPVLAITLMIAFLVMRGG